MRLIIDVTAEGSRVDLEVTHAKTGELSTDAFTEMHRAGIETHAARVNSNDEQRRIDGMNRQVSRLIEQGKVAELSARVRRLEARNASASDSATLAASGSVTLGASNNDELVTAAQEAGAQAVDSKEADELTRLREAMPTKRKYTRRKQTRGAKKKAKAAQDGRRKGNGRRRRS